MNVSNIPSIFDLMPEEEANKWKPIKSTDWKWSFKDYPPKNGLKVFSCFACGGGSTMGYKLCGCDVIGCVEIDPRMMEVYKVNHNPKYPFLMDIREFNAIPNEELPKELFDLDILDGSPPCSTFSMAGQREEAWGKKKRFKEGQKMQTLDDLLFVFLDTVNKLKPKVFIMENVEGLMLGEAWSYVLNIYTKAKDIGYHIKHYLLKGEHMGIPQMRHRVFFIGVRNDIVFDFENLDMTFNYEPVTYSQIKQGEGSPIRKDSIYYSIASKADDFDKSIADTRIRLGEKGSAFQTLYARKNKVLNTLRSSPDIIDLEDMAYISRETIINAQTFPQDYAFINTTRSNIGYICGMSVPPVMIKRIVQRLMEKGLFGGQYV